jgi:hypothetical protein
MAFPGTYNITYYKGDTFQFRIYPKNADGTAFNLAPYTGGGLYDDDTDPLTPKVPYDNAMFVFASSRGSTQWHQALAWISPDKTYVGCAIRGGEEGDSQYLTPGVEYYYDVQVTKPSNDDPDSPFTFPVITTLLTGTITVNGQVTP